MARKKGRKFPIFLAIIILVIIALGVMLKWNSGYTQNISESINAYNKFKDAIISGGTVSLSSDDINSIISKSFESQTHKGVTIEKIYLNMDQSKLDIKIPVAFKGQKFLVSSKGSVVLKDGCVAYLPDSFKIGAIPLSKKFVLSKLKAMYSSKFTIEADGIYINKSAVPVTINSIEIKDSNLKIGVEKLKINLSNSNAEKIRDELTSAIKNLNPSDKAKVEEAIKFINNNPNSSNILKNLQDKLNGVSNEQVKKIVNENITEQNKNTTGQNQNSTKPDPELVKKVSGKLSIAANEASDAAVKGLISEMKSQLDSGNVDKSGVSSQYHSLSKYQQAQLTILIAKNVNGDDARKLKQSFGW